MRRRDLIKTVGATATAAAATSTTASAVWSSASGTLSPAAAAARDWIGYTLPSRTTESNDQPRWIVRVTTSDRVQDIREWAEKESDRTVVSVSSYAPVATVAAPPADILGPNGVATSGAGLASEAFVDLVDVDIQVSHPEPVADLADPTAWEEYKPPHLWATASNLPKRGIAFSDDAKKVDATDVRSRMGVDSVSHTSGSGTTIVVLDTGCNYAAEEFGTRLQHGKNFITGETIDPSTGDYSAIESPALHGSWCTTMAAGASGIASSATVGHGKVLGDDGSGNTSNIVEGIRWATEDVEADVVSLSLGSPMWSEAMAEAIQDGVEKGVVYAVAAGNSRPRWISSPADTSDTLAVGASTTAPSGAPEDLKIAYFSQPGPDGGVLDTSSMASRGARPNVVAPGLRVSVPTPRPDNSVSPHRLSGTSMATPAVAGALAVFLGEYSDYVGEPDRVIDRATRTAARTPLIGEMEGGAGLLHLKRMFDDTRSEMNLSSEAKARDAALISMSGTWGRYEQVWNPTANYLYEV